MNRFSDWLRGILGVAVNGRLYRKAGQQERIPATEFPEFFHELRSRELKKIPNEGETVLSAGCAGTWYFNWFRQCYAGTIRRHIGIDAYSVRPPELPAEAVWIANSIQDMNGVRDGEVDLIFAGQMIEHIWPLEFAGFLCEAYRVLRPRGRLVMDSPNRDITMPLRWSHREHIIEYTTTEILQILHLAGFDVISIRGMWLCRSNGRLLPLFSPEDRSQTEMRIVEADKRPEDSFSWWVEALRSERQCRPDELALRLGNICTLNRPRQFCEFRRQIGKLTESGGLKRVVSGKGEHGFLHYGPYLPFPAGHHELTFAVSTPEPSLAESTAFILDATYDSGSTLLANREVLCCELDRSTRYWQLHFDLDGTRFGVNTVSALLGHFPSAWISRSKLVQFPPVL